MDFRVENHDDSDKLVMVNEAKVDDLRAVADYCAARRAVGDVGSKDMKLAASVPAFFVQKYLNDNGLTLREFMRDEKHINRFLSDPALAHFRVWQGKL